MKQLLGRKSKKKNFGLVMKTLNPSNPQQIPIHSEKPFTFTITQTFKTPTIGKENREGGRKCYSLLTNLYTKRHTIIKGNHTS